MQSDASHPEELRNDLPAAIEEDCLKFGGESLVSTSRRLLSAARVQSETPLAYRETMVIVSVTEDINMSRPSDLVQGTLDMLLLKIMALEPMHGFAVSQRLKQVSGDVLQVSDGSLYPALHKLEQEGWITADWKTSEYGRRAKYYSLTRLGRQRLEKEADNWGRLSSAISRVIRLKEA
jgi:PadR family transcriptional regulator, regulatory protein PadR